MGYDLSLVSMRSFTATTKRLFHHTPKLNMKAISNGTVLAESDETIVIEGNHYFPPSSIKDSFFSKSDTTFVYLPLYILPELTCRFAALIVDGKGAY